MFFCFLVFASLPEMSQVKINPPPPPQKKVIIMLKNKHVHCTLPNTMQVSFEWSHHRDLSTDSKVIASLKDPIMQLYMQDVCIYSGQWYTTTCTLLVLFNKIQKKKQVIIMYQFQKVHVVTVNKGFTNDFPLILDFVWQLKFMSVYNICFISL